MYVKLGATSYRGWPDFLVLGHRANAVFVELKTPKGKLSKLQAYVHNLLWLRRFDVLVIRARKDFQKVRLKLGPGSLG